MKLVADQGIGLTVIVGVVFFTAMTVSLYHVATETIDEDSNLLFKRSILRCIQRPITKDEDLFSLQRHQACSLLGNTTHQVIVLNDLKEEIGPTSVHLLVPTSSKILDTAGYFLSL